MNGGDSGGAKLDEQEWECLAAPGLLPSTSTSTSTSDWVDRSMKLAMMKEWKRNAANSSHSRGSIHAGQQWNARRDSVSAAASSSIHPATVQHWQAAKPLPVPSSAFHQPSTAATANASSFSSVRQLSASISAARPPPPPSSVWRANANATASTTATITSTMVDKSNSSGGSIGKPFSYSAASPSPCKQSLHAVSDILPSQPIQSSSAKKQQSAVYEGVSDDEIEMTFTPAASSKFVSSTPPSSASTTASTPLPIPTTPSSSTRLLSLRKSLEAREHYRTKVATELGSIFGDASLSDGEKEARKADIDQKLKRASEDIQRIKSNIAAEEARLAEEEKKRLEEGQKQQQQQQQQQQQAAAKQASSVGPTATTQAPPPRGAPILPLPSPSPSPSPHPSSSFDEFDDNDLPMGDVAAPNHSMAAVSSSTSASAASRFTRQPSMPSGSPSGTFSSTINSATHLAHSSSPTHASAPFTTSSSAASALASASAPASTSTFVSSARRSASPAPTIVPGVRAQSPVVHLGPDSVAARWSGRDYPWSEVMDEANHNVFGNRDFRLHQREAINASLAGKDVFVLMPTGAGKCWARGTRLMMYDGNTKTVESIKSGDLLMGDDSTPRVVLPNSLTHSHGNMYSITSKDDGRDVWECNEDHILVLKLDVKPHATYANKTGSWMVTYIELGVGEDVGSYIPKKVQLPLSHTFPSHHAAQQYVDNVYGCTWQPLVFECSLRDFIKFVHPDIQSHCHMFQPDIVHFPKPSPGLRTHLADCLNCHPTAIPQSFVLQTAWIIGLWLAHGFTLQHFPQLPSSCSQTSIETASRSWVEQLSALIQRSPTHHHCSSTAAFQSLHQPFSSLSLLDQRHLPHSLLTEDVSIRRSLLAGLIDGCGRWRKRSHQPNNENVEVGWELCLSSDELARACVHLARGLGCKVGKMNVAGDGNDTADGQWKRYCVSISGRALAHLPLLSAPEPEPESDSCMAAEDDCSAGFTIESTGVGEYFGFTVSGNGRMLMEDFTVTHNTLIYSLSAICADGLTVVFSPLLSLIQDQVQGMRERGIPTDCISGQGEVEDWRQVWRNIEDGTTKLLYITPEKFAASMAFRESLHRLYDKEMLRAFVIDEAHCISSWGHDFRPDYLGLRDLRTSYPGIPITCLTATATPQVVSNVQSILHLHDCQVFQQSFNRKNIIYEVRPKKSLAKQKGGSKDADNDEGNGASVVTQMAQWISATYPNQSGIIYCHSKKDCEEVAEELRSHHRLSADFYHAGLDPLTRQQVQLDWSMAKIKIICATIAFGMGINKPDVRFVIHYTMPKSIENFMQESGRAGRDGKPSHSIVYYTYADKQKLERMIRNGGESDGFVRDDTVIRSNIKKLYQMVSYCENNVDCRRVITLQYLGEAFDKNSCTRTCDNCRSNILPELHDVTPFAQAVLRVVQELQRMRREVRPGTVSEIIRGSNAKSAADFRGLTDFNALSRAGNGLTLGKGTVNDVNRLFHQMITEEYLEEYGVTSQNSQYPTDMYFLRPGPLAQSLLLGRSTMRMTFRGRDKVNHHTSSYGSSAHAPAPAHAHSPSASLRSSSPSMHESRVGACSTKAGSNGSTRKTPRPKVRQALQMTPTPSSKHATPKHTSHMAGVSVSRSHAANSHAVVHCLDDDDDDNDDDDIVDAHYQPSRTKTKTGAKTKAKGKKEKEKEASKAKARDAGKDVISISDDSDIDTAVDSEERKITPMPSARSISALSTRHAAASSRAGASRMHSQGLAMLDELEEEEEMDDGDRIEQVEESGDGSQRFDMGMEEKTEGDIDYVRDPAIFRQIHERLMDSRTTAAAVGGGNLRPWHVANEECMDVMARTLPCTVDQFAALPAMGKTKAARYFAAFAQAIYTSIAEFDIQVPDTHMRHVPAHFFEKLNKPIPHAVRDAKKSAAMSGSSAASTPPTSTNARVPLRPVSGNAPRAAVASLVGYMRKTPSSSPHFSTIPQHQQQPMQMQMQMQKRQQPLQQQQPLAATIGQKRSHAATLPNQYVAQLFGEETVGEGEALGDGDSRGAKQTRRS